MSKQKSKLPQSKADAPSDRRQFLKQIGTGAAVATAVLAAPNVARAQDKVTLKFQSTWPAKDIFNEFAGDYVAKVNEMAGGRLELQLLAAGTVVKAFELQQAVNDGILDGGHGVCAYWYGKSKAFSLFGTAPALGWNANQLLGWIKYGGGQAFYEELVGKILGLNLVGFLTGPMPTQPLGWFKKPVESPDAVQRPEISYRGPVGRPDERSRRRRDRDGRRRDRACDADRHARRGGIQQSIIGPGARIYRCQQGLHAAKLSPGRRML